MTKTKFSIPAALINKCKAARENANMTLEEMASFCGTTRQNIYLFEKGATNNGYILQAYIRMFRLEV